MIATLAVCTIQQLIC